MWHWLTWRNSRVRSLTRAVRLVLSIFQLPSISRPTSVLGPRPFGLPSFPGLPAIFTSVTGSSNLFSALPPPPPFFSPFCRLHSSSSLLPIPLGQKEESSWEWNYPSWHFSAPRHPRPFSSLIHPSLSSHIPLSFISFYPVTPPLRPSVSPLSRL